MTKQEFIDALVSEITQDNLFNRDEALAIIRSVRSETPDGMEDAFTGVVTWARKVRGENEVLNTILTLGQRGIVGVMSTADGDISLRLEPENMDEDGK